MTHQEEYDKVVWQIVWIFDQSIHGTVIKQDAYASLIRYSKDGIEYEEVIPNDDFVVVHEVSFGVGETDEQLVEYSARSFEVMEDE